MCTIKMYHNMTYSNVPVFVIICNPIYLVVMAVDIRVP